eukprot:GHRR01011194.1.p1 GENE.GHRR01011194.1~~GHRR01011194.1.p1  ORF type:complete len:447 (+),score=122.91 GHRR01011194.1:1304-2644(+)
MNYRWLCYADACNLVLQMLLAGGGLLNIIAVVVNWAFFFGLIPFIPTYGRWSWSSAGSVLFTRTVLVSLNRLLGKPALIAWANWDPRPCAWWWQLVLAALYVFVHLLDEAKKERRQKDGGSGSSGQQQQQRHWRGLGSNGGEAGYDAAETVNSKYGMGFGVVAVPPGCDVTAVVEVLQAKDYYQVMGFSSREECSPETLKAARRARALAVHPDKVGQDYPGANQAQTRVNQAFNTLSDPESRNAYDRLLDLHTRPYHSPGGPGSNSTRRGAAAAAATNPDWLPPYDDSLYDRSTADPEYMVDMPCPHCHGHHTVYVLPDAPPGVRWCRECQAWHPTVVKEGGGEAWAHWSRGFGGMHLFGRARILYSVPEGFILDLTDMFRCAGGLAFSSASMCNTHQNPVAGALSMNNRRADTGRGGRFGGHSAAPGGNVGGASRRSRKKGGRRR